MALYPSQEAEALLRRLRRIVALVVLDGDPSLHTARLDERAVLGSGGSGGGLARSALLYWVDLQRSLRVISLHYPWAGELLRWRLGLTRRRFQPHFWRGMEPECRQEWEGWAVEMLYLEMRHGYLGAGYVLTPPPCCAPLPLEAEQR